MLVFVVMILINIVMFVLFWLVVLDVGKWMGFWGILFGGLF